ncbi:MAG: hypothetical protein SWJ54_01540 [Cyanobacteriota bacterium]|nr:hypothetical protein [Cyanobacteriota bacterium]
MAIAISRNYSRRQKSGQCDRASLKDLKIQRLSIITPLKLHL